MIVLFILPVRRIYIIWENIISNSNL